MTVFTSAMLGIILQYRSLSNQHIVHLMVIQCQLYLNKSGEKDSICYSNIWIKSEIYIISGDIFQLTKTFLRCSVQ